MPETPGWQAAQLIQDFVNTREPQTGEESLTTLDALHDWFLSRGLVDPGTQLEATALRDARAIREGLRQVLLAHGGDRPDPAAVADLDRELARVPVRLSLRDGTPRLRAAGDTPFDVARAALVQAIATAAQDGSWARLKVCARDTCRWAFYDESRNRARRWCSMAGCGNHVKMQRAYAVRRSNRPARAAAPPPP